MRCIHQIVQFYLLTFSFTFLGSECSSLKLTLKRAQSLFETDDQVAEQLSDLISWRQYRRTKRQPTFSQINLTSYIDDSYFAGVTIGTPPMQYDFMFDTGRSDTWIKAAECVATPQGLCVCEIARYYNWANSTTYQRLEKQFELEYGLPNGSFFGRVEGQVVSDNFELGGFNVTNFQHGEGVRFEGPFFQHPIWTGVLGLGINEKSSNGVPSFLNQFAAQNSAQFGIYSSFSFQFLPINDLGFPRTAIFNYGNVSESEWEDRKTVSIACEAGVSAWKFKITKIYLNAMTLCKDCSAVIDTAYKYITASDSNIKQIHSVMETTPLGSLNVVDCFTTANLPLINVKLETKIFPFNASDYIITLHKDLRSVCFSAFVLDNRHTEGDDVESFTMGIPFIKRFYTIFNTAERNIRFVDLKSEYFEES